LAQTECLFAIVGHPDNFHIRLEAKKFRDVVATLCDVVDDQNPDLATHRSCLPCSCVLLTAVNLMSLWFGAPQGANLRYPRGAANRDGAIACCFWPQEP